MREIIEASCSWSKTSGETDLGEKSDSPQHGLHVNSLLGFVY